MSDKDLIKKLGGPASLCRMLGYDPKAGGVQRIQNWMSRGIPDAVRLEHYELFRAAAAPAISEHVECASGDPRHGVERRRPDQRKADRRHEQPQGTPAVSAENSQKTVEAA